MGIETSYSDLARELERRRAILHEYARKAGELQPGNPEKIEPFAECAPCCQVLKLYRKYDLFTDSGWFLEGHPNWEKGIADNRVFPK